MAQADQGPAGSSDPAQAVLDDVSKSLVRRGYFTTEWWTTIIGGGLSAVLALVHVSGSSATQVVAVAAPALLAGLYAITRTMHKTAIARSVSDLFPQATQSGVPAAGQLVAPAPVAVVAPVATVSPVEATRPAPMMQAIAPTVTAQGATPAGAVAETDPGFEFRGIPPIEDGNG